MLNYNAPIDGAKSSIDGDGSDQMQTFLWLRKSIVTKRKDAYFSQLSDVTNMPKHYGKTIKVHEYVPLLDDRNVNDQGIDANGAVIANGNLWGSSKDIGKITDRLPMLTENGGRVNRIGFTRLVREGRIASMGFFYDFTKESIMFDSDSTLMQKLSTEAINGAYEITEAVLQKDLLLAAGTVVYSGMAVSDETMTGEGPMISVVTYANLSRLSRILTENRTPKNTTIISGSKLNDTRVLPACRLMYVGAEVTAVLRLLKDPFGAPAFIGTQHYADAGTILRGEVGRVDDFRIIEVPEMLHWAGVGAEATDNQGYLTSIAKDGKERYDVFPMLVVGDKSFTHIGFESDGKAFKFNIMTKMPGKETMGHDDPYGRTGLTSIQWYYGVLILRPERIALIKTVAAL